MDIANLILQALDILIWPLLILIIVLIFKKQLIEAVESLSKIKYKDIEIEFNKKLKDAEEKASALKLPGKKEIEKISEPFTLQLSTEKLFELAKSYPRSAVTESWLIVEDSARRAAIDKGIDISKFRSNSMAIQKLIRNSELPEETFELYNDLRKMRNAAAHAIEFEIDQKEATRYVDLALSLAAHFQIISNI